MHDSDFQAAMAAGIKLLAARPRSIADLRARLGRKLSRTHPDADARADLIDRTVERLREYGYLDDERFAEQFVQSRVSGRAVGKRRVAQDLARQKVGRETARQAIDAVYAETPEEDVMERALRKYVAARGLPDSPQAMKRMMDHLLRQGFPTGLIVPRVRALARTAKLHAVETLLDAAEVDGEES